MAGELKRGELITRVQVGKQRKAWLMAEVKRLKMSLSQFIRDLIDEKRNPK